MSTRSISRFPLRALICGCLAAIAIPASAEDSDTPPESPPALSTPVPVGIPADAVNTSETAPAPSAAASASSAPGIAELRDQAERLRAEADATYRTTEAACHRRFLVNRCIDNAKSGRLTVVRRARALEAEAHRLELAERNRLAAEVAGKADSLGIEERPTAASPPAWDTAAPTPAPRADAHATRKEHNSLTGRGNARADAHATRKRAPSATGNANGSAKKRTEAARRAEAARKERERYDARIREYEEKKARDANGR
ncbi:MAG: hypothetical protein LBE06_07700 [Azoarcus sp.]|jgi:hypothetical protein|nr:hypothetical protein [Azoarcus sp.]